MEPNILSPTLRERKRYIAYQVISEQKINFSDLSNAIWNTMLNFLGEIGASEASIRVIKNSWDEAKQIGLIKCDHLAVEKVRAALALIDRIGDARIIINVLGISGTIKAARRKFFGEIDLQTFV